MDAPDGYDRMIEQALVDIKGEIGKLKDDVSSLKTWRAFVLGCAAPMSFLLGAFAHEIALFLKAHS